MGKCKEIGNKVVDLIFGRKRRLSIDNIVVGDEQDIDYLAGSYCPGVFGSAGYIHRYHAQGTGRDVAVKAVDLETGEKFERRYQTLRKEGCRYGGNIPYHYIFRTEQGTNLDQLLESIGKTVEIRMKTSLPEELICYLMEMAN